MYVCLYVCMCMTKTCLAGCYHNTPQKAPKPVTFISPGAWLSLELLPGLLPPELQDLPLPVLAPAGGVAACPGRPLPLPAAIRLWRPREEKAMRLADPTLAPAARRGVAWLPADDATALCGPTTPETGE